MNTFSKCLDIFCPVCKSEAEEVMWTFKQWKIVKCSQCDLEFSWPFVPGDLTYYCGHETYNQLYKQVEQGNIPPGNQAVANEIDRALRLYIRRPMKNICVLDYGCGSGFYAAHFGNFGCDVVGVDFNPEMVRVAHDLFGVKALIKSADELLSEGLKFDLIMLNQVLEHVGGPTTLLNTLGKLLNNGGIIFVSVPNRDFIRVRKKLREGKLPEANYPPHHISFWSAGSLYAALSASGLKVLECSAQTYPEVIQTEFSLCNRFGGIGGISRVIALFAAYLGKRLNLAGVNLFAIGAIHE